MSFKPDSSLIADLWFFRSAAETVSFVQAADRLAVTQSAVSQRIQRLEARLETQLFHRGKRGLQLTGQGEMLFKAVVAGFGEIEVALSSLSRSQVARPVTISCVPSLALEWLTPRLAEFYRFRPDIAVSLVAEIDSEHPSYTRESFDLAIRYAPDPPDEGEVVFEIAEEVFPVLSPYMMEKFSTEKDLEVSLLHDAEPWAKPRTPTTEWDHWLEEYGSPFNRRSRDVFVNLAQLCYRAAMEGMGVAMGRNLVVRRHLRRGTLVRLEGAASISSLRYFVLAGPGPMRRDVTAVLNWLKMQMVEDLNADA